MKVKLTSLLRTGWLASALTLFLAAPNLLADTVYVQTNLVSNSTATPANFTDANLINPWGNVSNGGSPFWASDQMTSVSTLYDSASSPSGMPLSLVVKIPGGNPTGIVANAGNGFVVNGAPAHFIFATLEGTIVGWNGMPVRTEAVTEATVPGAVFTGLATDPNNTMLYAADFQNGKIDVFNSSFAQVTTLGKHAFRDPHLPKGYLPYNIQLVNGKLYVEYSKGVPGAGDGVVDVFTTHGHFVGRLITKGRLNVPWGIAQAPASFGQFGGDLLVGNFGNGWINAFNPGNGRFVGTLESVLLREAREFGHEADEADAAHAGDEGVVLRHIADQGADLAGVGAHVAAEDAGRACSGLVEAEPAVEPATAAIPVLATFKGFSFRRPSMPVRQRGRRCGCARRSRG